MIDDSMDTVSSHSLGRPAIDSVVNDHGYIRTCDTGRTDDHDAPYAVRSLQFFLINGCLAHPPIGLRSIINNFTFPGVRMTILW
jgi:hypothetical protein